MKNVIILDPKGVIPAGGKNVIKRHEKYSNELNKLSKGDIKLIVITNSINQNLIEENNLEIFSTNTSSLNLIKFISQAKKIIHNNEMENIILVAGDPWEPAWCANQIKKSFIEKIISIEVQAHGDFADQSWKYLSIKNWLRYFLMSYGLKIATTIRVTSETQKKNFAQTMKIPTEKMFVIPVFMDLKKLDKLTTKPDGLFIGLLGRIHFDRGLKEFVKLLKKLNTEDKQFKVLIAGSGPKINWLMRKTSFLKSEDRVYVLGNLDDHELQNFWSKINVLVSMAPFESFGRAMREAIASGIPVWAIKSTGSLELHKMLSGRGIYLINPREDRKVLFSELSCIAKSGVDDEAIRLLIEFDEFNLIKLIENWILNSNRVA